MRFYSWLVSVAILIWPGLRCSMPFDETRPVTNSFCTIVPCRVQDMSLCSGMSQQRDKIEGKGATDRPCLNIGESPLSVYQFNVSSSSTFCTLWRISVFPNLPEASHVSGTKGFSWIVRQGVRLWIELTSSPTEYSQLFTRTAGRGATIEGLFLLPIYTNGKRSANALHEHDRKSGPFVLASQQFCRNLTEEGPARRLLSQMRHVGKTLFLLPYAWRSTSRNYWSFECTVLTSRNNFSRPLTVSHLILA